MTDTTEQGQVLANFERWRGSCIFYFKFDLALIAATAAAISFFNIHGLALIATASQYKATLIYLICLLMYALIYEWFITSVRNHGRIHALLSNDKSRILIHRILGFGYDIQVLAHLVLLAGALGYSTGYVNGFMSSCHMVAGKCIGT